MSIGIELIRFTNTFYTVNEDMGSLMICAQNNNLPAGVLGCNLTVQTTLLNGTACACVYHVYHLNKNKMENKS